MTSFHYGPRYGRSTERFHAPCEVCGAEVTLLYTYEWSEADPSIGEPAYQDAYDPEILEQDCDCLLGEDFVDHALREELR